MSSNGKFVYRCFLHKLHSFCTQNAFILYTKCIHFVHKMHSFGTQNAFIWYTKCIHFVHKMHSFCTQNALILYTKCINFVHKMHSFCTQNEFILYTKCIHFVHRMHSCCTQNALILYTKCIHFVHKMHSSFCTQNAFILYTKCHYFVISFNLFVFMARPHNVSHRTHSWLAYHDFRDENCLTLKKNKKQEISCTKHNGELSTTYLVIARFQKAVTSLFFGRFCLNFHWFISTIFH